MAVVVHISLDCTGRADRAVRAVGRDHQARVHHTLDTGLAHAHGAMSGRVGIGIKTIKPDRAHAAHLRQLHQPRLQRLAEVARDHDASEHLAAVSRGFEHHTPEVACTCRMDAPDRPRGAAQVAHDPERVQCVAGRFAKAEVALVEHRGDGTGRRGIQQHDIQLERGQCNGQAGPDHAASDDQDIALGRCVGVRIIVRGQGWLGHCVMLAPAYFLPSPH